MEELNEKGAIIGKESGDSFFAYSLNASELGNSIRNLLLPIPGEPGIAINGLAALSVAEPADLLSCLVFINCTIISVSRSLGT